MDNYSLLQIHSLFSILALSHAYVTSIGKLVGVVTLSDVSINLQIFVITNYQFIAHLLVDSCHSRQEEVA